MKIYLICFLCFFCFLLGFTQTPEVELVVQSGHTGAMQAMAFSPDGKCLVTSAEDKKTIIWDTKLGLNLKTLSDLSLSRIAFSPDGTYFFGAIRQPQGLAKIGVWNWKKKTPLITLLEHTDLTEDLDLVISPDGSLLAACSPKVLLVYQWQKGELLLEMKPEEVLKRPLYQFSGIDFSPDGKHLVYSKVFTTFQEESSNIEVMRLEDQTLVTQLKRQKATQEFYRPEQLRFVDNQEIAIFYQTYAGADTNISLWEWGAEGQTGKPSSTIKMYDRALFDSASKRFLVASGELIRILNYPYESVHQSFKTGFSTYSQAWEPNGNLVALSLYKGAQGRVDLFNEQTGNFLESWGEPLGAVTAVDFGENGFLASVNLGHVPRLWQLQNNNGFSSFMVGDFVPTNFSAGQVYLSDDAQKLVYTEHHQHYFWDTDRPGMGNRFEGAFTGENRHLAISPDQNFLVSIYGKVYDFKSMRVIKDLDLKQRNNLRNAVTFSPDGKYLIISSFENLMRWRLPDFERLPDVPIKNSSAYQVAVSVNGFLATLEMARLSLRKLETGAMMNQLDLAGEDLLFSPDGSQLFVAVGSDIHIYAIPDLKRIGTLSAHTLRVNCLSLSPNGQLLASGSNDGLVKLWDWKSKKLVATLAGLGTDDFIIYTPDHYYMTRRGIGKVAFQVGEDRFYSFEQFDLQFNRPDIVLDRIGFANNELIDAFRRAYAKRMEKFGFTENKEIPFYNIPTVQLSEGIPKNTKDSTLILSLQANDQQFSLKSLHVLVNEVPVFGELGKKISSGKSFQQEVQLPLLEGNNYIQVFVKNEKGISSLQESFDVFLSVSRSKPDLYLVAIGVSKYADENMNLKYAAKDAQDVAALFESRPGAFRQRYFYSFLDEKATRSNILKIKPQLEKSRPQDKVVFFVAGHGILDKNLDYFFATHHTDFNDPGKNGIRFSELEALLDGIPALQKTLLIDACHAGEVDKDYTEVIETNAPRGGEVIFRAIPGTRVQKKEFGLLNSFDLMKHLFTDLRRTSGTVVIAAAGGAEYALEGDEYQNGVFTYTFLQGLRETKGGSGSVLADKNEDQKVSISELQAYLIEKVAELTNNQQRPLTRVDYLYNDFSFLNYHTGTKLAKAHYELSIAELDAMIEAGLDIIQDDEKGVPFLMRAVYALKEDDPEFLESLIKLGADPRQKGAIYLRNRNNYLGNLLSVAAYTGKHRVMEYLIEEKGIPVDDREWDPESETESGWTALQRAVIATADQGDKALSVVEVLLNNGADINQQGSGANSTPLLLTLGKGKEMHQEIAHLLIERGADLSLTNEDGWTALHFAVYHNQSEIVKKLLEKGMNPLQKTKNGKTPVDIAIGQNHNFSLAILMEFDKNIGPELAKSHHPEVGLLSFAPRASRKLLATIFDKNKAAIRTQVANGADINARDHNGAPYLMHIARQFDFLFVKEMIEVGGDCDQKGVIWIDREQGAYYGNLMGIAASKNDYQLVEYLIKNCKIPVDDREYDPFTEAETGWTALQWAAGSGALGTIDLLLDYNANLDIGSEKGETPLLIFMQSYANAKYAEDFIERGADVTIKDQTGGTALHYACRDELYDRGGRYLFYKIIEKGGAINSQNNSGWTPLMYAAASGHHLLCLSLIEAGADCNLKNELGQTALDIARKKDYYQTVEILQKCQ